MPFLDSFQACFKDRHRYFAGFYFQYRLLIPVVSTFSESIIQYYIVSVFIILVVLFMHTTMQPYKQKWQVHNQI